MYSSLQRIDMVIKADDGDVGVQTDHREPDEIEAQWNVSVVLAAARARNPVRSGQCARVRFAHLAPPPPRMKELVSKLGAELQVAPSRDIEPGQADPEWVERTVEAALLALGRDVFARAGLSVDCAGLKQLEQRVRAELPGGPEGDTEIAFFTAVVELGAALIAVVQAAHGGRLVSDKEMASLIPFRWDVNGALTNVFGRVERYLEEDATVLPSQLVGVLDEREEDGRVMFSLRAPDWAGRGRALTVPLFDGADRLSGQDLPLCALVVDLPTTTRTFPKDTAAEEIEKLRADAHGHLENVAVSVEELGDGENSVLVVHGDYYAGEKLLDRAFMAGLAQRLGAKAQMLLVAAPVRGRLFVRSGMTTPAQTGLFARFVEKQHADAPSQERISPAVMIADASGTLLGVAQVGAAKN